MTQQSGQGAASSEPQQPAARHAHEGIVLPADGSEPLMPGTTGDHAAPPVGSPWGEPWGPDTAAPAPGAGQAWGAQPAEGYQQAHQEPAASYQQPSLQEPAAPPQGRTLVFVDIPNERLSVNPMFSWREAIFTKSLANRAPAKTSQSSFIWFTTLTSYRSCKFVPTPGRFTRS